MHLFHEADSTDNPEARSVKIIAEVGSVHDGSFGNALKLIDVAAECGIEPHHALISDDVRGVESGDGCIEVSYSHQQ